MENTITINGNYITELETPPPSKLPWIEHTNRTELLAGEPIVFQIDAQKAADIFDYADLTFFWEFVGMENVTAPSATITFPKSGPYIVNLYVSRGDKGLASETILVQVGTIPDAAGIILSAPGEARDITSRRLEISRSKTYSFQVSKPDTAKFSYTWDLGDQDIVQGSEVSKQFLSTLLPSYVVLRTTDNSSGTYIDSYIRIESERDFENGVPMPPFNPESGKASSEASTINPIVIVITSLILLLLTSTGIYIYLRRQRSH